MYKMQGSQQTVVKPKTLYQGGGGPSLQTMSGHASNYTYSTHAPSYYNKINSPIIARSYNLQA